MTADTPSTQQIPLPFSHYDRFDFDSFWPGDNTQACTHLQTIVLGSSTDSIYLWGEAGTGKSHLLQAACSQAGSDKRVAYIPLSQYRTLAPQLLDGLDKMQIVCIDGLEHIAGYDAWELAIFNLYNQMREQNHALLFASRHNPSVIDITLADLKSRLSWGVTYHLLPLDEAGRIQALQKRAQLRGFELSHEVLDYLTRRVARDMHNLFDWLNKLDDASLREQRRLTVPFVKKIIEGKN